jgi:hypothetical protein
MGALPSFFQIELDITLMFLAAFKSLFQIILQCVHSSTPTPSVPVVLAIEFFLHELHTLDVLYSSIVRTTRDFLLYSLFF